jgi:tetratricopeptide (TPR) repeat protein
MMVRRGRRRGARLSALLVLGMFLNLSPRAEAAAEDDKAVARAHHETGTRLYDLREYSGALKEYRAAYLAKPDPAFLFNIGQCLRKLGHNTEALDFFREYLKKAPPDNPNRDLVETLIHNIQGGLSSEQDPFDRTAGGQTELRPAPEAIPPPAPGPISPSEKAQQPAAPSLVTPNATQPAGVDLTVSAPATEEHASTPTYRTWWFWTGMGAVVVAGTVTAIVIASRGGGTDIPGSTLGARPLP